jgi:hypothetical protein
MHAPISIQEFAVATPYTDPVDRKRRRFVSLRLVLCALMAPLAASCTKSIRIQPDAYRSAFADTTRSYELHMKNGTEFVSRRAAVVDSVVVIKKGYQVQTDPWRQMDLLKPPITLSLNDVDHVTQVHTPDRDNTALVIVLGSLAIALGFAFLNSPKGFD